jgi:hypothetical protein
MLAVLGVDWLGVGPAGTGTCAKAGADIARMNQEKVQAEAVRAALVLLETENNFICQCLNAYGG